MQRLRRHATRVAITLLPLVLAILHVLGVWPITALNRLDDSLYDARLRVTAPATHDPRIVIVDIDEQSLAEVGRWPWSRHRVAELVNRLFNEHRIRLLGFDTVFAEPDTSSGLEQLQRLAQGPLAEQHDFVQSLAQLQPALDFDARLAEAIRGRPVVLGYYFTSDRDGRRSGILPAPVMAGAGLAQPWNGYGANIAPLVAAAPRAGFFNAIPGSDGVVRALPLVAVHEGQVYESLALALFRNGVVSADFAARMADKPLAEMLQLLSSQGLPLTGNDKAAADEARQDMRAARAWLAKPVA